MVATITIGSCVSVHGRVVRNLEDGRVSVRVADQTFTGRPVSAPVAA